MRGGPPSEHEAIQPFPPGTTIAASATLVDIQFYFGRRERFNPPVAWRELNMNTWQGRMLLRAAILAGFCGMACYVWWVEANIDLKGIPLGGIGFLLLVPAFLGWFFVSEIWRPQITRSTFAVPFWFVLILAIATRLDQAAYEISHPLRYAIANDLKQISLAMLNYQKKSGTFPSAIVRAQDGKPLYSWRVMLLPYLEQEQLFKELHLDEPWDSPDNHGLIDRMPKVYAGPGGIAAGPGLTYYQVLVGKGAAFEADRPLKSPLDFPDGLDSTILIAEARHPVIWTQPDDLVFDANQPLPELGAPRGKSIPRLCAAAMVDGRVLFFDTEKLPQLLRPWITRNAKDDAKPIE
jgi:hypothetical protein